MDLRFVKRTFKTILKFINVVLHFQLKTNQGRYILTSSGDLQIVQLHRTDAGTYVCVAYNGLGGSVEREVKLTVDGELTFSLLH